MFISTDLVFGHLKVGEVSVNTRKYENTHYFDIFSGLYDKNFEFQSCFHFLTFYVKPQFLLLKQLHQGSTSSTVQQSSSLNTALTS